MTSALPTASTIHSGDGGPGTPSPSLTCTRIFETGKLAVSRHSSLCQESHARCHMSMEAKTELARLPGVRVEIGEEVVMEAGKKSLIGRLDAYKIPVNQRNRCAQVRTTDRCSRHVLRPADSVGSAGRDQGVADRGAGVASDTCACPKTHCTLSTRSLPPALDLMDNESNEHRGQLSIRTGNRHQVQVRLRIAGVRGHCSRCCLPHPQAGIQGIGHRRFSRCRSCLLRMPGPQRDPFVRMLARSVCPGRDQGGPSSRYRCPAVRRASTSVGCELDGGIVHRLLFIRDTSQVRTVGLVHRSVQ